MRYKRAVIDSLNLSSYDIEKIFDNNNYIIEPVKSIAVFEPKRWSETFGKPLTRNIIEASILHTHTGLTVPLKRYAVSPQVQTIEFAGLHGYNEPSKWRMELLRDKESLLQDTRLMRIDVAIDYHGNIPKKIIQKLLKRRYPFEYKHTTYFKTPKEKKTNPRMDIKRYDKAKKEKLGYPMQRLEFVFKSDYLKGLYLRDLEKAKIKMQKTIKLTTGLEVKIALF